MKNVKAIVFGSILLLLTGSYLFFWKPIPVGLGKNLEEIPLIIDVWEGRSVDLLGERFEGGLVDSELKRVYSNKRGNNINLYLGYFAWQSQNREIVNHRYDWLFDNSKIIEIELNPHANIKINKARYRTDKKIKYAYFWYVIDGNIVTNRYKAKLSTLINTFINKKNNAALVVMSFESDGNNGMEDPPELQIQFLKAVVPVLQTFLANHGRI